MDLIISNVTRQKLDNALLSVTASFGDLDLDDSIKISSKYIKALEEYWDLSCVQEDGTPDDYLCLLYTVAKAIYLRKENNINTSTTRFKLGNHDTFPEKFVSRIHDLTSANLSIDRIAAYFDSDSKLEDLDFFYNAPLNKLMNRFNADQTKDMWSYYEEDF